MDPILIMIGLCLLVPVVGFFLGVLPIYAGIWGSLYWIYMPKQEGEPHPVGPLSSDYEPVLAQYEKLYDYWLAAGDKADFYELTLPLFLPPIGGVLVAILLLWMFYRYVRGIFRVDDID